MSSILEIFFPLCAADPIRWQRHTPDVEHGIWPDVADERLQQWLQTDAIRLYIPGEWISVWQVELPDVPRKQIPTILPALLEEARVANLPVIGLMCVPPAGIEAAPFFALLDKLARDHGLAGRSMGMSDDFETAIMLGATHVRVGSALFGARG